MNLRPITICADDYAIAPGVSRAIRDLAGAGRISATSCMTATRWWEADGAAIRDAPIDLGLHLVLTDGPPLGPMPTLAPNGRLPSFPALLRAAWFGRLGAPAVVDELRDELHRQLDRFEAIVGRPPDHLDGHQHVHQLPGVRAVVLEVASARLRSRVWVRNTYEPATRALRRGIAIAKALVLARAAAPIRAELHAREIPTNQGFSGLYAFDDGPGYAARCARFLADLPAGGVMMCHPGYVDDALVEADPVTHAREAELAVLAGDALPELLTRAGVRVARLSQLRASP